MGYCNKHNQTHTGFGTLSFCASCENDSLELKDGAKESPTSDKVAYWVCLTPIKKDEICVKKGDQFWIIEPKTAGIGCIYQISIDRTEYTLHSNGQTAHFNATYIGVPIIDKIQ